MFKVQRLNDRVTKLWYNDILWYAWTGVGGRYYAECPTLPNILVNQTNLKQIKKAIKNKDFVYCYGAGKLLKKLLEQ